MKMKVTKANFNEKLKQLKDEYDIFAPVALEFKGHFSDTDSIRYQKVEGIDEMELGRKSQFSPKEIIMPMSEVLFHFTEDEFSEPTVTPKKTLVFLRACDIHGMKRTDEIYLRNGFEDPYYKKLRDQVKFVLIACEQSFRNCFCVSMGTNQTDDYSLGFYMKDDNVILEIKDKEFVGMFSGETVEFDMPFVDNNDIVVNIPEQEGLGLKVKDSELFRDYDKRCIACGKCNFVCPTCTCFTMQDIFYKENENNGERRRVWASCHVDGYTDMAGGHEFRKKHGDRMRFKTLHKIYDFNKKFGYHMCVGCGRCDDACPTYISFSTCINKINDETKGEK